MSEQAFRQLFNSHYAAVSAYVRRRAPSDAVDDIVAEVFTTAWRRFDRIPVDVKPWLFRVAKNVIATQRRSFIRREALLKKLQVSYRDIVDVRGEPTETPSAIAVALSLLSESDREAITLIMWDDLTPAEAAAVLGVPPTAFRVRLHRAKKRLRREFLRVRDSEVPVVSMASR
jgi:RNA polymerase sigma factor (sigma-70 family)